MSRAEHRAVNGTTCRNSLPADGRLVSPGRSGPGVQSGFLETPRTRFAGGLFGFAFQQPPSTRPPAACPPVTASRCLTIFPFVMRRDAFPEDVFLGQTKLSCSVGLAPRDSDGLQRHVAESMLR